MRQQADPQSHGPATRETPRHTIHVLLVWIVILGSLALIYGPALLAHMERAADPGYLQEDARQQIPPFFKYGDPTLPSDDYIDSYYLACYPIGYRLLYTAAAIVWDPVALSNALPYVLLALTLLGLALTARRFGGPLGAWGALALCLGSVFYRARMAGGLPRSFAFAILAAVLAALVYGKFRIAAAIVCLGTAFYPAAGLTAGLALAVTMFLPASTRGDTADWSLARRLQLLGFTAALSALLLVPTAIQSRQYGPLIRPADQESYPEAGAGGRYGLALVRPFPGFVESSQWIARLATLGDGQPWLEATRDLIEKEPWQKAFSVLLLSLVGIGWTRFAISEPAARRMLALLVAAFLGNLGARIVPPYLYLPQRYVWYTVPLLANVMLATCFAGIVLPRRDRRRPAWLRHVAVGLGCLSVLLFIGGRGSESVGFTSRIKPDDPLYRMIAGLPSDSLIAGWPGKVIEDVPIVTRRKVFLTREAHQAFHAAYVLEMRHRMEALIAAYFATSPDPLVVLREEFGVTHLVVQRGHFRRRPPRYFRPFDRRILKAVAAAANAGYEIPRQIPSAAIYSRKGLVLLDLARIEVP